MAHFIAWGMTGTLATEDPAEEADAYDLLEEWIARIDRSCNRFRAESEISIANRSGGGDFACSPTFERALLAARRASELSSALCDPTVLDALEALGYDRDFTELASGVAPATIEPRPAPGPDSWSVIDGTLHLDVGVRLDLGATAKALLADAVVEELAPRGGALVEVGGDVSLIGHGPEGPWVVGIAATLAIRGDEPRVSLDRGGLATSSTTTRSWRQGDHEVNHIIDPRTGRCADGPVAVATVAGPDCVGANALATAALLWGDEAPARLTGAGVSARLVRHDGTVEYVGGWPSEEGR